MCCGGTYHAERSKAEKHQILLSKLDAMEPSCQARHGDDEKSAAGKAPALANHLSHHDSRDDQHHGDPVGTRIQGDLVLTGRACRWQSWPEKTAPKQADAWLQADGAGESSHRLVHLMSLRLGVGAQRRPLRTPVRRRSLSTEHLLHAERER